MRRKGWLQARESHGDAPIDTRKWETLQAAETPNRCAEAKVENLLFLRKRIMWEPWSYISGAHSIMIASVVYVYREAEDGASDARPQRRKRAFGNQESQRVKMAGSRWRKSQGIRFS